ncbi:MAG: phosphoglycerate dehydrogenase, partial [Planctomycetota bacterium]|nr:phosphoglycerate dehydrogenase [Planctomycetota bacterium]
MNALRILVADDLGQEGIEMLAEAGEVKVKTGMTEDQLRDTLPGYHALIVRSATKVTARSLERASDLVVIGRAGIGIDNIDVAAATERGIVVMNTPEAGAVTTGELAVALMMCLARNLAPADASMKAGRWDKKALVGTELRGKTLGVIGLGRIGTVVAERGLGLRMDVITHDPFLDSSRLPVGVRQVRFDELLAHSDFISIHVPKGEKTMNLINAETIAKMKPGVRLIHAARGGIVDEDALVDALESGHLAGAALDVFSVEPLPENSRLRSAPNLLLSPHLGASTREAKRNVSLDMARQMVLCLKKGVALNGINVPRISPAQARTLGPFLDLARNLASFLTQVFPGRVESLRLSLQGKLPGSAAHPLEVAMLAGALRDRAEGPVTPVNAERIGDQMGVRRHTEVSTIKRDFVNVVRVEALIDGERHYISGTVLGHRHGRMVELDHYLLDAIPEGPMLVTFHGDQPGVVGAVGQILHEEDI